jgi:hypothetical protein
MVVLKLKVWEESQLVPTKRAVITKTTPNGLTPLALLFIDASNLHI